MARQPTSAFSPGPVAQGSRPAVSKVRQVPKARFTRKALSAFSEPPEPPVGFAEGGSNLQSERDARGDGPTWLERLFTRGPDSSARVASPAAQAAWDRSSQAFIDAGGKPTYSSTDGWKKLDDQSRTEAFDPWRDRSDPRNAGYVDYSGRVIKELPKLPPPPQTSQSSSSKAVAQKVGALFPSGQRVAFDDQGPQYGPDLPPGGLPVDYPRQGPIEIPAEPITSLPPFQIPGMRTPMPPDPPKEPTPIVPSVAQILQAMPLGPGAIKIPDSWRGSIDDYVKWRNRKLDSASDWFDRQLGIKKAAGGRVGFLQGGAAAGGGGGFELGVDTPADMFGAGPPGQYQQAVATAEDASKVGLLPTGSIGPSQAVVAQPVAAPPLPAAGGGGGSGGGGGGGLGSLLGPIGAIAGSFIPGVGTMIGGMAGSALGSMMKADGGGVPRQAFMRGGYPELYTAPRRRAPYARGYVADPGHGTGRSDSIDASLSGGEFVMDAETTSMLGDGSNEAGARKLEKLRQKVRSHKGKALAKGKFSPDAKEPEAYMSEKLGAGDRLAHGLHRR